MSLIEVMIAMGVSMVVLAGMAAMMTMSQKEQKKIAVAMDANQISNMVQTVLDSPAACQKALSGNTLTLGMGRRPFDLVFKPLTTGGSNFLEKNQVIGDWKVESITATPSSTAVDVAGTKEFIADITVVLSSTNPNIPEAFAKKTFSKIANFAAKPVATAGHRPLYEVTECSSKGNSVAELCQALGATFDSGSGLCNLDQLKQEAIAEAGTKICQSMGASYNADTKGCTFWVNQQTATFGQYLQSLSSNPNKVYFCGTCQASCRPPNTTRPLLPDTVFASCTASGSVNQTTSAPSCPAVSVSCTAACKDNCVYSATTKSCSAACTPTPVLMN